ncbi:hypothetical protein [Streptomyces sp. 3N207]|uniref:hypothetical protein n=1 Tax=Streptomyces sp. 3N207 TaxID=3457417 RepID=UPI003FD69E08
MRRTRHPGLTGLGWLRRLARLSVRGPALRLALLRVAVTGLLRLALLRVPVARLLRLALSATVRTGLTRLLRLLSVRLLAVRSWLILAHGGAFPSVNVLQRARSS